MFSNILYSQCISHIRHVSSSTMLFLYPNYIEANVQWLLHCYTVHLSAQLWENVRILVIFSLLTYVIALQTNALKSIFQLSVNQVIHSRHLMNLPAILTADDLLLTTTVGMALLSMQIRSLSLQKTKCMSKIMLINKVYDLRKLTLNSSTQKLAYIIWKQVLP